MTTLEGIREAGFIGFQTVSTLQTTSCRDVPQASGVYLVLRPTQNAPVFLNQSIGGHFKQRDPTCTVQMLQNEWVSKALVLYIGKAGGPGSNATLKKRIQKYMRFGMGKPVGHWGGRYIWQLADSRDLVLCWKVIDGDVPGVVEENLISQFRTYYGKRPFANLRD